MAAGRKTRSVSLEADKSFVDDLGTLAKMRNTTIGKLVKQAIDEKFGADLNQLFSFFAQSGIQINHSDNLDTKPPGAA